MTKTIGVILSGCGVQDGAEIHESVLTLLFLKQAGVDYQCFAPNTAQRRVVNHFTGEIMAESRTILVEAGRIARGDIMDVAEANAAGLDAVIMPGGFGAALNLSSFALEGAKGEVDPDVRRLLLEMNDLGKPIGAICIAPATLSLALGHKGISVTIGNDADTAASIEKTGAKHVVCTVDNIVVDTANKVITTPAYMLGPDIAHIAMGIQKLCNAVVEMA